MNGMKYVQRHVVKKLLCTCLQLAGMSAHRTDTWSVAGRSGSFLSFTSVWTVHGGCLWCRNAKANGRIVLLAGTRESQHYFYIMVGSKQLLVLLRILKILLCISLHVFTVCRMHAFEDSVAEMQNASVIDGIAENDEGTWSIGRYSQGML